LLLPHLFENGTGGGAHGGGGGGGKVYKRADFRSDPKGFAVAAEEVRAGKAAWAQE
jgi:hypothetical protein